VANYRIEKAMLKLARAADELGWAIGELRTALGYADRHEDARWSRFADAMA